MQASRYFNISSSSARISSEALSLNLAIISGMDLEVVKMLAPNFVCKVKISDKILDLQPLDAWHSSRASMMKKILECIVATDWSAPNISSNFGCFRLSLWLSYRRLTLSGREDRH